MRAVSIPGIDDNPDAEFDIYRTKAREFQFEMQLNDLISIRNGISGWQTQMYCRIWQNWPWSMVSSLV